MFKCHFCAQQDQKAHEAILKVLNLERVDRLVLNYLVSMFSAICDIALCQKVIFYNISSIAREPKLDEWVARATILDTLHDTVSVFSSVSPFLEEIFSSLVPCN